MGQKVLSDKETSCCEVNNGTDVKKSGGKFLPFVQQKDGKNHLTLHVDGIHCARCIWAIESNLQKQQGIEIARVNMSTSRLTLVWTGCPKKADSFAQIVGSLGYGVTPLMGTTPTKSSEATQLQRAMAIAGFAMGNIMLLSVTLWSSDINVMGFATRELLHWVSALIALPTIAYSGRPFFRSAYKVLKQGHTNMDVPISLALLLASGMSLFETMNGGEHAYFDSAVMLLFFLLVGRWLDAKARGKAHQQATELLELLHGTATLIKDGGQQTVLIKDLQAGDLVLVAAGEKIPSDSEIISGCSEVDTSAITGESAPRLYSEGEKVFGGTMNISAPLTCRILQASEDSTLAEAVRLMEQAEQGRAQYVRLADKAARLYTPVVHTLAALAFLGWFFIGGIGWQEALLIAITTLIITCPCALGLAVPVVQVLTVGWLMKRGILVKSADALEKLNVVNTIVLDKTGTLTLGKPKVKTAEGSEHHLALAASLADQSKHPLSQAISAFVAGNRVALESIEEIPGKGIQARWKDHSLFLGKGGGAQANSTTVVFLIDGKQLAVFTLVDELRPDALETLKAFTSAGLNTHLLSGDYFPVVRSLAESLNISDYDAEILPAGKLEKIKHLEKAGNHCLMVGDGLNDAPALAQAHVSMSPSTGMDITQNTANMVFQGQSLYPIYLAWKAARQSTRLVKQNFALAVIYNCIAIPIALMGYVTPMIAAIAMSSSSLLVIGNAFRIRLMKDR